MSGKNAEFRVKLISGGRITIPTAIRELLGIGDGDYIICSVSALKTEELPRLNTLWRILKTCRKGLTSKEIARRCRLSAPAATSYVALLADEKLLSVDNVREHNPSGETYRTTQKGLRMIDLLKSIRGSHQ